MLDPLAALLLFIRPRIGVAATIAIITSDVVHNLWFVAGHRANRALPHDPFLLSQIAFLVLVGLTARLASPDADRPKVAAGNA